MVRILVALILPGLFCFSCRAHNTPKANLESSETANWWKKDNWKKNVPQGYDEMEIEAKWTLASAADFQKLVNYFNDHDKDKLLGYRLEVRWGRQPRLFHDRYFDTKDGLLETNHHTLRHRQRLKQASESNKPWSGKLSKVMDQNYKAEWDRVQYKSTPTRIGPVWFRNEVGECLVWSKVQTNLDNEDGSAIFCPGIEPSLSAADKIIGDIEDIHPAITQLLTDHPNARGKAFKHTVDINDWRYRVVFQKEKNGKYETMYEMSIDGLLVENVADRTSREQYEVEMEIIQDTPRYSDNSIDSLMDLCRALEIDLFKDKLGIRVKHSEFSKSGVR